VALAVAASLLGSGLSDPANSQVTISDPIDLLSNIQSNFDTAILTGLKLQAQFLNDSVILPLLWYLLNNGWKVADDWSSVISSRAQTSDRITFYQLLVPLTFELLTWDNCPQNQPFTWYNFSGSDPEWISYTIPAPSEACQTLSTGNNTWNISVLCAGAQLDSGNNILNWNQLQYPSEDLMEILAGYQSYGVNFFVPTNAYTISVYLINMTNPGGNSQTLLQSTVPLVPAPED
jgi:hypothetical protein